MGRPPGSPVATATATALAWGAYRDGGVLRGPCALDLLRRRLDAAQDRYARLGVATRRLAGALRSYRRAPSRASLTRLLATYDRFQRDDRRAQGEMQTAERRSDRGLLILGLVQRARR